MINNPEDKKKVFFLETGDGNDFEIIWLHGWGQNHKSLVALSDLFKKKSRNLIFDLPGFGQTDMLQKGASTLDYAHWLYKELGEKTKPRILIGHSYGGRVSVQMAANYPNSLDGIILIAGAGLKRDRSLLWNLRASFLKLLGKMAGLIDRVLNTKLKEAYSNKYGSRDYKNAGDLRGTFVSAVTENLIAESGKVTCPTLLIYGEEDTETPPEIGEKFNTLIKDSELKVLKGFDHFTILSHGANQCENLISRFLEKIK